MINNSKVIALIPARAGSKGIKGKNMRYLCGSPMLDYTLKAASEALSIDEVYLSSDSDEMLDRAKLYCVKPLKRPTHLCLDDSSAYEVVEHFISEILNNKLDEDVYLIYLQPTSPLRTSHHIDDAVHKMTTEGFNSLVSVVETEKSPFKSFVINAEGAIEALFDEKLSNQCRQNLPKAYFPNGAIYIFTISQFLSRQGFPSNGSYPYIMSQLDSVDVDTESDLAKVENYLRSING